MATRKSYAGILPEELTEHEFRHLFDGMYEMVKAEAFAKGVGLTGSLNGRIVRIEPDGTSTDLGPVIPTAVADLRHLSAPPKS